jgi:tetratricopeptide (TPR) repeat protein
LIGAARERFNARDYYGALLCLEDLSGSARSYADVHHLRGLCYTMLERHREALVEFDHALALNPGYVDAHLHRGLVYDRLGNWEEARRSFDAARAVDGPGAAGMSATAAAHFANRHASLADEYAEAGQLARAVEEYRRAVELRPGFLDLRLRLGRLLLESGNPLGARDEFAEVLRLRPDWVEARVQLGMARYLAGDVAGARVSWEECLKERPELGRVAAYLAMVERIAE